jgi:hypothetical protein
VEGTRLCYKYCGYLFLEVYVSIYLSLCIVILNLEFFKGLLAKCVAVLFVAQCVCWVLGKLATVKPNPRATENKFETYSL